MCGPTASLPRVSMIALAALAAHIPESDTIAEGYRVVPTSEPQQVSKGAQRAEAVATYLRIQNRELVERWSIASEEPDLLVDVPWIQAGAAATEAMADVLDALAGGEYLLAKKVLEQFVNVAVDTGVVTL